MSNVSHFISEFNLLHRVLMDKADSTDDFYSLLKALEERNEVVDTYKDELHQLRRLRNILVHEKDSVQYNLAEPSQVAINRLMYIKKKIEDPSRVKDLFIEPVTSYYCQDGLADLLEGINTNNPIGNFPIFDNKLLKGVISPVAVTRWFAKHYPSFNQVDLSQISIQEIISQDDEFENFLVIHPNQTLYFVEDIFISHMKDGETNFTALVSEENQVREPSDIIGLISSLDLPQIMDLI